MSANTVPNNTVRNPTTSAAELHLTPEHIAATALATLPAIGPQRLRLLLDLLGAVDAWRTVRGELAPGDRIAALLAQENFARIWRQAATDDVLRRVEGALHDHHISVVLATDPLYPSALRGDHAAPAVLFARGNLATFAQRRAGVIGTRAASAAGRHFARGLGRDLSRNGVAVVSGLARGIDAAAHLGVIDAFESGSSGPIAVVATGLDVVYPREHTKLWSAVAECGVIISESPPGCGPDAFRFPLRNRILAAASEVLVVVESRATGGSMITVEQALSRSITVMAVPGAPQSESSVGSNRLISQGAATVCDATDVLVALGLNHQRHITPSETRVPPSADEHVVLAGLSSGPLTFEQLVERLRLPIAEVALRLGRLEAHGWVVANAGWWEALVAR